MKTKIFFAILALSSIAFVGCRSHKTDFPYPVKRTVVAASANDVRDAILRAGTRLGWTMRESAPGVIDATLTVRAHFVASEIRYTDKDFSILYRSSENMNFDPADGKVHRSYNRWTKNLAKEISAELRSAEIGD